MIEQRHRWIDSYPDIVDFSIGKVMFGFEKGFVNLMSVKLKNLQRFEQDLGYECLIFIEYWETALKKIK